MSWVFLLQGKIVDTSFDMVKWGSKEQYFVFHFPKKCYFVLLKLLFKTKCFVQNWKKWLKYKIYDIFKWFINKKCRILNLWQRMTYFYTAVKVVLLKMNTKIPGTLDHFKITKGKSSFNSKGQLVVLSICKVSKKIVLWEVCMEILTLAWSPPLTTTIKESRTCLKLLSLRCKYSFLCLISYR